MQIAEAVAFCFGLFKARGEMVLQLVCEQRKENAVVGSTCKQEFMLGKKITMKKTEVNATYCDKGIFIQKK